MKNPDNFYMDIATRVSQQSRALRNKVGAVLVSKDGSNILAFGFNGTAPGEDNICEFVDSGALITKSEVRHAEENIYRKLADERRLHQASGGTLYLTLAPCVNCVNNYILPLGIDRVVFSTIYRNTDGLKKLREMSIIVDNIDGMTHFWELVD